MQWLKPKPAGQARIDVDMESWKRYVHDYPGCRMLVAHVILGT
jgi:hypothetical protein